MGKKRKGGGGKASRSEGNENSANDASKLRINTFEDVADSEDDFHVNRDKILLDEAPALKKQRRMREEGEYSAPLNPECSSTDNIVEQLLEPSDEEVLAESDDLSSSLEDELIEDDASSLPVQSNVDTKHRRKPLTGSDEDDSPAPVEDEDAEGWGTSRKDYYDADVIETEADALEEEAEARRLQQKQLQDMTEADFGLDATAWLDTGEDSKGDQKGGAIVREVLPKLVITDTMGLEERSKIMKRRYPEFEPLAKEFLDLQAVHRELTEITKKTDAINTQHYFSGLENGNITEHPSPRATIAILKYRALSGYLGSLSMYFALLTSGAESSNSGSAAMPPEELRDHSIMETLIQCRDLWEKTKKIPLPDFRPDTQEAISYLDRVETKTENDIDHSQPRANGDRVNGLQSATHEHVSKHQKKRLRKAERLTLAAQEEANSRREERLRQAEISLQSLPDFTKLSAAKLSTSIQPVRKEADNENESDFGDATSLTAHEAAEKARRRKSLKFYTSQIAQKSSKRDGAGRDAGGDVDVPYRERLRDRQERLNAEAERRGKKPKSSSAGAVLDVSQTNNEEMEPTNAERRQNGAADDTDNEYYDLIAKKASDKKASKAAQNAAASAVAAGISSSFNHPENASLEVDGKRAITYAIEKNKGLHPHRKKDVRNPRVKKRKKFEEKKKKLGSVRAVYKSDREGKGGYGGEKTGIKRGLVRSVKL